MRSQLPQERTRNNDKGYRWLYIMDEWGATSVAKNATGGRARAQAPTVGTAAPKRRSRCRRMAPRPSLFRDQYADPLGAVVEEWRLPVRNLSPLRTKARPLGALPTYMQPSVYTQLGTHGCCWANAGLATRQTPTTKVLTSVRI
jgi:hypothetical protein